MHKRNTVNNGFTIVELLVVIVVIAILAAISIVAYTGIQNRAKNSQIQSVATSYVKSLQLFEIDHGSLPTVAQSGSSYVCLGQFSDDEEICANSGTIIPRPQFTETLSRYRDSNSLPRLPNEFVYTNNRNSRWRGIWFEAFSGRLRFVQYKVTECPRITGATVISSSFAYDDNITCTLTIDL